ncbi:hypothetical protein F5B19DRAFT_57863 [Rostrohypoxylon terebratum]|nr:hypothetical protein F5B19DRAFT_57863 [Rostrohypoxylon terebratum]
MAHNKTRMSPLSAQHPFFTPIFQPKALTFLPNRDPLSPLSPTLNRTRGLFFVAILKTFYHCSAAFTVVIQLPTQDLSNQYQYPVPIQAVFEACRLFYLYPGIASVQRLVDRRTDCITTDQLRNQSHSAPQGITAFFPVVFATATGFKGTIPETPTTRSNGSLTHKESSSNDSHGCFPPGQHVRLQFISRYGRCPHSCEVYCIVFFISISGVLGSAFSIDNYTIMYLRIVMYASCVFFFFNSSQVLCFVLSPGNALEVFLSVFPGQDRIITGQFPEQDPIMEMEPRRTPGQSLPDSQSPGLTYF